MTSSQTDTMDRPASDELRALYELAFVKFGDHALWSSRPVEQPTVADVFAITESLRVEGGVRGRQHAVHLVTLCRAAL